ncbi:ornithine carbamoyltransferase [Acetanaerobacterium elongatum]|uniref:Ornithine carbamoyltransferase n=1 Tax=Acetanaerobacterium elongatum TaxID=258515 RepID=A0A1G9ZB79_9FIRM|nr:hypothetical protein [Acetanaerobacterium elongatum]SDN18700.1 ornithine carbamoyltransferase [Acetanaerobacterium elongatum]
MPGLIALTDLSGDDLIRILDRADILADAWKQNKMPQVLKNKQVGLWFYGQGFRNRVAFEIGARAMGASVSYIPGELGINEPLEDVGHYLDNWFSLLVIRSKNHKDVLYLSNNIDTPIINARTNYNHPCEILGDLQFIRKYRGSIDGLNVVFVGEITNLCMSWFEAAVRLPISVTQVAPDGYLADKALLQQLNAQSVGEILVSSHLDPLLRNADLIYTDCWPRADNNDDAHRIKEMFLPYQITSTHLQLLKEGALFLPCPPVTRGQEVSFNAMKSPVCLNYEAKDYLLHSQNAVLEFLAGC